ncbi:MAG: methionine--tRNA ligase [Chloroflexi bacterium]|nr:methionine--tRNA ligase [Chloroflexota bacterium]MBT4072572.1 methionine--tRNA ligase [Chloroflexota bacterium]MBT4515669.1 methionine--tRNA ligase [Chloroflexota bacterium]MBT5320049.1 methionine--tRNA ligase [Chloroflexota bacterium]MBT6681305.1 methionine--tRNA ligase [Chloroflexota bacterium]
MAERVLVAVAWPYVNGRPHLGHIAGNTLPADIFARYHRLVGDDVLMVSGSDMHGTPTMLAARQEGVSPRELAERYHDVFVETNKRMGFSYDLYTHTDTENHHEVTQCVFTKLLENGYLVEGVQSMPFCLVEQRFLSDRFVEGVCPHCSFDGARGDQCDNCGNTVDPADLGNIRCKEDGSTPEFRDTTHFFLRLSAFQDRLTEWISEKDDWRPNVRNFSMGMLREGLKDRAITRDIDWGVAVPVDGFDDKRIYVWFEAVIGYLSASIEWAKNSGKPDAWKAWWQEDDARAFYFQGKDNIPFHTIIWPAMLMGHGGLNLAEDVPANEFLTLEGRPLSTSSGWAVWLPDYLERYDADPLRYYLTSIMPETSDSDFTWDGFLQANNNELVATFGNLAHRVLTLTTRNFDDAVPEPGELGPDENAALEACDTALKEAGEHLAGRRFREGLRSFMALAQHGNRYIDTRAPWKQVKEDRDGAATTLWTALNIIETLRTISYPYLPHSSQTLHELLGHEGDVLESGWQRHTPEVGTALPTPTPMFQKLDDSIVEEEADRLAAASAR